MHYYTIARVLEQLFLKNIRTTICRREKAPRRVLFISNCYDIFLASLEWFRSTLRHCAVVSYSLYT